MPEYVVSIKKGLNEAEYDAAGKHIKDQGGQIIHTFKREGVSPGYLVEFPANSVTTLQSYPHVVGIEGNGLLKTQ